MVITEGIPDSMINVKYNNLDTKISDHKAIQVNLKIEGKLEVVERGVYIWDKRHLRR